MRHPLGLPRGSVRALLLLALGARALIDLRDAKPLQPWLLAALLMSIAAYFSARSGARSGVGGTVPDPNAPRVHPPLFLPSGTIRTIVLLGVGYGAWLWFRHRPDDVGGAAVVWVLGAFALGVIVRWMLSRARRPEDVGVGGFGHLEALVALACAAGLVAIGLGGVPGNVPSWTEPLLAAAVVFYFGSR